MKQKKLFRILAREQVKESVLGQAAVTDTHRLGGFDNRYLSFHSSGGWKAKVKMLTNSVSEAYPKKALLEGRLHCCRSPHMAPPSLERK